MFSFVTKIWRSVLRPVVKPFIGILGDAWRWVNPTANTMQAQFVKMIVGDLVRDYISRNPKTLPYLDAVDDLVDAAKRLTGLPETVLERVVRSILHELGVYATAGNLPKSEDVFVLVGPTERQVGKTYAGTKDFKRVVK